MSIRIIDSDDPSNPMYGFSTFWDFVVLCLRVSPGYTLRSYLYAIFGWGLGMSMGLLVTDITRAWIIGQALILLFLLAACSLVTYWSLRKQWDYMRSTNLVRKEYRGIK